MIIFAAIIAAVVTFLLAVIAAAVTLPLAEIGGAGSSWAALEQMSQVMILAGPLGVFLLGVFVASGREL